MKFPPRPGRASGTPRARISQRTSPGSSPLSLHGILCRQTGPALNVQAANIHFSAFPGDLHERLLELLIATLSFANPVLPRHPSHVRPKAESSMRG